MGTYIARPPGVRPFRLDGPGARGDIIGAWAVRQGGGSVRWPGHLETTARSG